MGANFGAATVDEDLTPVYAGRLEIRPADHAALVDGRPLILTVRELQLLTELAHNAERVMTRRELYARVDLIADADGAPALMELELIEPYHYPEQGPGCGARFAEALTRLLEERS